MTIFVCVPISCELSRGLISQDSSSFDRLFVLDSVSARHSKLSERKSFQLRPCQNEAWCNYSCTKDGLEPCKKSAVARKIEIDTKHEALDGPPVKPQLSGRNVNTIGCPNNHDRSEDVSDFIVRAAECLLGLSSYFSSLKIEGASSIFKQ